MRLNDIQDWSVYVMAAPERDGWTYFKVGRSVDVSKRFGPVQTGCPLKITNVWILPTWDLGASQRLEKKLHETLAEFGSWGEWFHMDTSNPSHKKAMNDAFSMAAEYVSQVKPVKWRQVDIQDLRDTIQGVQKDKTAWRKAERDRLKQAALGYTIRQRDAALRQFARDVDKRASPCKIVPLAEIPPGESSV